MNVTRVTGVGLMTTLLALGSVLCGATPAFAQTQPATDWSWYVRSYNTSQAYQLGYNQGSSDLNNGWINSQVTLDFGAQQGDGSGTCMTGYSLCNGPLTNAQVENYAEQFALGYWNGTGADYTSVLMLGIGTNNSGSSSASLGTAWANVVNDVKGWLSYRGYNSQINAGGANDIEPSWNSVANSNGWSNGFHNAGCCWYIDFGSADGCSTYAYNNTGCSNSWVQDNVWWAAWGNPAAQSTPEIYIQANADQWFMIAKYSFYYKGSQQHFQGPMDQYDLDPTTFTSAQAWNALSGDINADGNTAHNMPYSVQIHIAS